MSTSQFFRQTIYFATDIDVGWLDVFLIQINKKPQATACGLVYYILILYRFFSQIFKKAIRLLYLELLARRIPHLLGYRNVLVRCPKGLE